MSPIIYSRHRCTPHEDPEITTMARQDMEGVLWQCPDCHAYWETEVRKASDGQVLGFVWDCLGRPREQAILREVEDALNATAPTVTEQQLAAAISTYTAHTSIRTPYQGPARCAECDWTSDTATSIRQHAIAAAATELNAALAAGEEAGS